MTFDSALHAAWLNYSLRVGQPGDSRRCSRTRVTLAVHEEMAVQRGCRAG